MIPRTWEPAALRAAIVVMSALLASTIAGCGAPAAVTPPPAGPGASDGAAGGRTTSAGAEASSPATPATDAEEMALAVYLVRGEKVQPVNRVVPRTTAVIRAAVDELVKGPTASERAAGLFTTVPASTRLRGVSLRDGIAYVDVTGAFDDGGGTLSESLRLAQLTHTVTRFPGVTGMVLKMDGRVVEVFSGEGIELAGEPQTRAGYEELTPPILLESPAWGATLRDGSVVRGTANVFEGRLTVEILDASGRTLAIRDVAASAGTGTRGTWSARIPFTVASASPGRVKLYTLSPKDGKPAGVVSVPVRLSP